MRSSRVNVARKHSKRKLICHIVPINRTSSNFSPSQTWILWDKPLRRQTNAPTHNHVQKIRYSSLLYQISHVHWHFINLGTVVLLYVSQNFNIISLHKIYSNTLQPMREKQLYHMNESIMIVLFRAICKRRMKYLKDSQSNRWYSASFASKFVLNWNFGRWGCYNATIIGRTY